MNRTFFKCSLLCSLVTSIANSGLEIFDLNHCQLNSKLTKDLLCETGRAPSEYHLEYELRSN